MPYRISQGIPVQREVVQQGWAPQQMPGESGECLTDTFCIGQGLNLLRTQFCPRQDLVQKSRKQLEQPVLAITLGLLGESMFRGRCGTELYFQSGYTTVSAFQSVQGERLYQQGREVSQLRLLVGAGVLDDYLGKTTREYLLGRKGGVQKLVHRPTSGVGRAHVIALLEEMNSESLDKLQVHIRALNLLAEQLRHLDIQWPRSTTRCCPRDTKKLDEARAILENGMDLDMSIPELAAAVGLNESKLRTGFRNRFNKSPHRLQMEIRMNIAWQLLETGCQVAEVAYSVGYEYPGNFSAAFSRYFGCVPKSVFGPKRRGRVR